MLNARCICCVLCSLSCALVQWCVVVRLRFDIFEPKPTSTSTVAASATRIIV